MGFETPGDQRIPVTVRDWNALKLAAWRSKVALTIIEREALAVLERCAHVPGCPGIESETAPCSGALSMAPVVGIDEEGVKAEVHGEPCPDREQRVSALVILNAARQFLDNITANKPDGTYFAPSREYFSEVLSDLAASQVHIAALTKVLRERFGMTPEELAALNPPIASDSKKETP
jgi:hypothetical protein